MADPEQSASEHDDEVADRNERAGKPLDADEGEPDIEPFAGKDHEGDPKGRRGGHGYGYE